MFDDAKKSKLYDNVTLHVLAGLGRECLMDQEGIYGDQYAMQSLCPNAKEEGIIFQPSEFGVELFLWAYGRGDLGIHSFLKRKNQFEPIEGIAIPSGCLKTRS